MGWLGALGCSCGYLSWRILHIFCFCVSVCLVTPFVDSQGSHFSSCLTARRRRRRGMNPYRGTGWAAGRTPAGHAPAQYTGAQPYIAGNQAQNQPAPPYSPTNNQAGNQGYYGNTPGNQGYYGNNQDGQGFFGGQQNGVELQQPNSTYQPQRGGDPVYTPPPGPPPGKGGDGIIR